MQKTCENCAKVFNTKDARQKTCGKSCADVRRSKVQVKSAKELLPKLAVTHPLRVELPPPEELPAPYAKRVYDMWATLVGTGDVPTRIA